MKNPSMRSCHHLSLALAALLPIGALAGCDPGGSGAVSTRGQLITCETDDDTGVILSCDPDGDGGDGTCTDIDDDGDGDCHDEIPVVRSATAGDHDGDGVPDEEDCDEHPGEDDDDDDQDGDADLPYDVAPQLGEAATPILDAFGEKGPLPAEILSVTLDGGTWRLGELQAGLPFIVTAEDCEHEGNRDVGRDRVVVTWRNASGSTESDHLDIRYCER